MIIGSPGVEEYSAYNKMKEGYMYWSHLAYELFSKTYY